MRLYKQLLIAIIIISYCNTNAKQVSQPIVSATHNKVIHKHKPQHTNAKQRIETHVVVDYTNGEHKVIHENMKDTIIYPASLTKMMTVYILLEKVANNEYKMGDKFTVSINAERQEASKTPAKRNEIITVEDTIKAIMAWSANDMAVVVAENVAGSVENFCKLMNAKAQELKMYKTNFCNPSGLHNPRHVSTANDMAKLAIALSEKFNKYKYLLSTDSYRYKNTVYKTRCKISKMMTGVHCAKTGFTYESWFNLATTATRYNNKNQAKKICVVVIGRQTSDKRYRDTITYMNNAFKNEYIYVHNAQTKKSQTNTLETIIDNIALNKEYVVPQAPKNNVKSDQKTHNNTQYSNTSDARTQSKNTNGIIYIDEVLYVIDKDDICIGRDNEDRNNVIIEM